MLGVVVSAISDLSLGLAAKAPTNTLQTHYRSLYFDKLSSNFATDCKQALSIEFGEKEPVDVHALEHAF